MSRKGDDLEMLMVMISTYRFVHGWMRMTANSCIKSHGTSAC
jgi:hypothetical protein